MVRAHWTARVFTGTRLQVEATHSSSVLLLKMDGRHGAEISDTRHASIQRKTPQAISVTRCSTREIQHMDELFGYELSAPPYGPGSG